MTDVQTTGSWSNDLDQVRATVQALQGTAALLQGAMEQREALSQQMRTAEEQLSSLEQRRAQAEHALLTAASQLTRTTQDLERVRTEQNGVLGEFDRLVQGALSRRGALLAEIAELQSHRDTLSTPPSPTPFTPETFEPSPPAVAEPPAPVVAPVAPALAEPIALVAPVVAEPVAFEPSAPVVAPVVGPLAARMAAEPAPAPEAAPTLAPVIALPLPERKRVRRRRMSLRTVASVLLGTLLLGMAVLITPVTELAGGLQLLAVLSGSMEPTIHVGGIVGVLPVQASDLQVGDIITFANQSAPDVLVTHRIANIEERGGQELLTTRGDANDSADAVSVPATRAVGRVEFTLPWLGYAMVWLASPMAKLGIVAITVIGFALTSIKRPTRAPKVAGDSYAELESEIAVLLPRAS